MSFIRVLMIVIQYIEPSKQRSLFAMTLAKEPTAFRETAGIPVSQVFFGTALSPC
jgi:hypothetical protein